MAKSSVIVIGYLGGANKTTVIANEALLQGFNRSTPTKGRTLGNVRTLKHVRGIMVKINKPTLINKHVQMVTGGPFNRGLPGNS